MVKSVHLRVGFEGKHMDAFNRWSKERLHGGIRRKSLGRHSLAVQSMSAHSYLESNELYMMHLLGCMRRDDLHSCNTG
eukprot:scaffold102133_cov36-Tisochrysis_lutea.AAC.4